jgi:hypothetical protein
MLPVAFLIGKNTSSITAETMTRATNVCLLYPGRTRGASSANHFTQLLIASESLYIWVIIFLKVSLGIFFLRILVDRWQRVTVYIIVTFASLVGFAYFWYAVFQCGAPNDSYWEKRLNNHCAETPPLILGMGYLHAVVTAFTDIALALVPVPVIIRSQISFREKLVVFCILTMALM